MKVNILVMWTIYDHPEDFPDCYVARKWLVGEEGLEVSQELLKDASLDSLRKRLPNGLFCIPRYTYDDPVIVETWL